jgi:hypothetical protein
VDQKGFLGSETILYDMIMADISHYSFAKTLEYRKHNIKSEP